MPKSDLIIIADLLIHILHIKLEFLYHVLAHLPLAGKVNPEILVQPEQLVCYKNTLSSTLLKRQYMLVLDEKQLLNLISSLQQCIDMVQILTDNAVEKAQAGTLFKFRSAGRVI